LKPSSTGSRDDLASSFTETSVEAAKALKEADNLKALRGLRATQNVGGAANLIGPVGFLAGALEVKQTAQDLSSARTRREAAESGGRLFHQTVAAAGDGAETVATAAAASRVAGVSKVALAAGKFSGVAGGIAGVAEGGIQVYAGTREGDAGKAGTGALKVASGSLMLAGVATANPVLLGAGGTLYAGTTIWENREALGQLGVQGAKALGGTVRGVERAASRTASAATERIQLAGQTARKLLGLS
jgi:hypothetical protein